METSRKIQLLTLVAEGDEDAKHDLFLEYGLEYVGTDRD